jgi:hypothetical protein
MSEAWMAWVFVSDECADAFKAQGWTEPAFLTTTWMLMFSMGPLVLGVGAFRGAYEVLTDG